LRCPGRHARAILTWPALTASRSFPMSILDTFCAVDLETTGLDPRTAEVIEVGAVRVTSGKVADRFHTYIKPRGPIPEEISRLTGVTADDVEDAPGSAKAMKRLAEFIGELPVVGYQGRFEQRFLSAFLPSDVSVSVLGARDLAKAALPRLRDHSVESLAGWFDVTTDAGDAGKALLDAEFLAGIYQATAETLQGASLRMKQQMLRLLEGTTSDLLPVFVQLGNEAAAEKRPHSGDQTGMRELFNVGGREPDRAPVEETPLNVDEVKEMFEPGGLFEREMPGFEYRPQQMEMATATADAFNREGILAVEAGTGVGKSMAYLAPAVRYAMQNNTRVVVSTNTKNLQEQLFHKDLPDLDRILDTPFKYALIKGRSNYICLNRFGSALTNPDSVFTDDERVAALPLVLWAEETATGDISENTAFDPSRNASLWGKVCSESGSCRSQRCKNNGRCFANAIRKEAQKSHLVVVNHSLLFSDMSSENGILGEFDHLILDEAHHIERVAASYLGRELTVWRVRNLTEQLRSSGLAGTGTLPALRHWVAVSDLDAATLKAFDTGVKAAIEASDQLQEEALSFFEMLTEMARSQNGSKRGPYSEKIRYRAGEMPFNAISTVLDEFESSCREMIRRLEALIHWLADQPEDAMPNRDELQSELEGRASTCNEILDDLGYLAVPDDAGAVYWMELPVRETSSDTRLFAAPLDVAALLRTHLYDQKRTLILTSATLSVRGRLKYFLHRMGLDDIPDRVASLCLGSPFDFERQALVCAPTFVPSPKEEGFQEAVEDVLRSLSLGVRRGTMALFTSYSMLNRAYGALRLDLKSESIRLLGQGVDGTPSQLMERFKAEESSVLLGTDSFWEGVDVPGEALEVLAIVRLPFAVPSEPLVAARMEELEKQGKNPFMHYSVPEAILKFRQGFGRLIRNGSDRGVVVVLDSRVTSTRYGQAFLESLPVRHQTFGSLEEMVASVQAFFEGGEAEGEKSGDPSPVGEANVGEQVPAVNVGGLND